MKEIARMWNPSKSIFFSLKRVCRLSRRSSEKWTPYTRRSNIMRREQCRFFTYTQFNNSIPTSFSLGEPQAYGETKVALYCSQRAVIGISRISSPELSKWDVSPFGPTHTASANFPSLSAERSWNFNFISAVYSATHWMLRGRLSPIS